MRFREGECFSSIHLAESAIQRDAASGPPWGELIPAAGPQKVAKGNSPRSRLISVRMEYGQEWMSKNLRPSAGYMGRGVMDQSAVEYILYHQKSLAQVKPGSSSRNSSQ